MSANTDLDLPSFAFVEYPTPEQANSAINHLNGMPLDKKHTMRVNKLTDIDRYGREGRVDEEYHEPTYEPYQEKEHLRSWLFDRNSRDQFALHCGDKISVMWNHKEQDPQPIVERAHWTQTFVQWSPEGTFLASMHPQGVQLWGGPQFSKQKQFPHPFVQLIQFSPAEHYLTTFSSRPIEVDASHPILSPDEDGKHIIVWDITTGKPLRSFVSHDVEESVDSPQKGKIQWPALKYSADEKYVARMHQGQSISVYELPSMHLLDKQSIKFDGVMEIEWAPANPTREGVKDYESLLAFWTPEVGSNPATVGLMSIPSKQIVRTRNLFNVSDVKLHWQSLGSYLCVKVDRHSKSKKSLATNLEIFRVKEKGVPVEVVDSMKDIVINFAWEPKGNRFVLITSAEAPGQPSARHTAISFFCPEKVKGNVVGNFKHIRTIEKKTQNAIIWSPRGRFVITASVSLQSHYDLDFWDLDYEGEKPESDKDLCANLRLLRSGEHYGVTDIDWDPSGRYVVTSASAWTHQMENGWSIHTFSGQKLAEHPLDKFKQFQWRPRPATFLTKEEQKKVRRTLRDYTHEFEEEDKYAMDMANTAIVEERRRLLGEWQAWFAKERSILREEQEVLGLAVAEKDNFVSAAAADSEGDKIVEEIVEEILEEKEEVIG